MFDRGMIGDYLKLAGGSVGRLVISLAYFLVAANVLSLADFGWFATASAAGVVLSRLLGFGYISPLFRAATVKPRVVGAHLGGYFAVAALSLPLVGLIAWALHASLFRSMPGQAFALILVAEVLAWRMLETAAIINNGLRRFGAASSLVLAGAALRTLVALGFWWAGGATLTAWAWCYLGANAAAAALAWIAFTPRFRLRLNPRLSLGRARDALSAGAADILFYLQAELDKAVVLLSAGPRAAGLYSIAMRIVDITAVPIRSFNQLAMQRAMTDRKVKAGAGGLALVEIGIAAVSVAALFSLIVLLWLRPGLLGANIQSAAALFWPMLLVPAFRNLTEYHAELLYGIERTGLRVVMLGLAALAKTSVLWLAVTAGGPEGWAAWVVLAFLAGYAVSAPITYRAVASRAARP